VAKLIYMVTEDWYFYLYHLLLAIAVLVEGFEVNVVTQVTNHGGIIESAGIKLILFYNY